MGSIWSTKCNNIACNMWNNILKKDYGFQQPIFLVVFTKKQMLNLNLSKMLPSGSLTRNFSTKL